MNKGFAILNLCISGFYVYNILMHMIKPGENTGYTRMLMFVCLATIPITFMMMIVGGSDNWTLLVERISEESGTGPLSVLIKIGIFTVAVFLPLGLLIGVWFMMGLRLGLLFLLYFVPTIMPMVIETTKAVRLTAGLLITVFFVSMFIALGIISILKKYKVDLEIYERHVHAIWPGYGTALNMFFIVSTFALLNQIVEFGRALSILLGKN